MAVTLVCDRVQTAAAPRQARGFAPAEQDGLGADHPEGRRFGECGPFQASYRGPPRMTTGSSAGVAGRARYTMA